MKAKRLRLQAIYGSADRSMTFIKLFVEKGQLGVN